MARYARIALLLAVCVAIAPTLTAQDRPVAPQPKEKGKAKIEFRWLEGKAIKGVTEENGFQTTCGPALSYAHLKPVLTNKDVASTRLRDFVYQNMVPPLQMYSINFNLTDEALKTLTKECGDKPARELAVFVDGKYCGTSYFRKAEVGTFSPHAGFFTAKEEAVRIVEACK